MRWNQTIRQKPHQLIVVRNFNQPVVRIWVEISCGSHSVAKRPGPKSFQPRLITCFVIRIYAQFLLCTKHFGNLAMSDKYWWGGGELVVVFGVENEMEKEKQQHD